MTVTAAASGRQGGPQGGRSAAVDRERLVVQAFQHCAVPLAVLSEQGTILEANAALSSLLGVSSGTPVGHQLAEYIASEDRDGLAFAMGSLVRDELRSISTSARLRNGVASLISVAWYAGGGLDGAFVVTLPRHECAEDRAALMQQAYCDSLTGLANRSLFEQRLDRALDRIRTGSGRAALFLLDLDDFKGVNDTLGHHVGDELLVALTDRLRSRTREGDTLCRFGGDEFLVLAEDVGEGDVEPMARRIMSVLDQPFQLGGSSVTQHASVGVVLLDASMSAHNLIESADIAMYEAKRGGKSRFVTFRPHMKERAVRNFELAQEILPALERGEIELHYQPIVEVKTGQVVGFEALMRWTHPKHGQIRPDVFIGLAEQTDVAMDLGRFALREACRALVQLTLLMPGRRPYVAVNITARHFYDRGFHRLVEDVLTATGLSGDRLVIEVTETGALGDLDESARTIRRLEMLNVTTAIDDFGTGYSSLSYLPRLTPAIIKIDRSFVSGAPFAEEQVAMLRAVVGLSHTMGARVIAEGVETEEELLLLNELGCELAQGFLFSRAIPYEQIPSSVRAIDAQVRQLDHLPQTSEASR